MFEIVTPKGNTYSFFVHTVLGWVRKPWAIERTKWSNQHGFGVDIDFTTPFFQVYFSVEKLTLGNKRD
jgi:hypothetical protein